MIVFVATCVKGMKCEKKLCKIVLCWTRLYSELQCVISLLSLLSVLQNPYLIGDT